MFLANNQQDTPPDLNCHTPDLTITQSIPLIEFVRAVEERLDKQAIINFVPMHVGEAVSTFANVTLLNEYIDYCPTINVNEGVGYFIEWYLNYYHPQAQLSV